MIPLHNIQISSFLMKLFKNNINQNENPITLPKQGLKARVLN